MQWSAVKLHPGGGPALFTVSREEGRCKAVLWDMTTLYVEELEEQEVLNRAKDLNRGAEYDLESLMEIFGGEPKENTFDEDRKLTLKYYLAKIPFRFFWDLQEDEGKLSKLVTIPLLLALKQAKDREVELLKIIQKKEEEKKILSMGGNIPITKVFDVQNFQRETPFDCIEREENKKLLSEVIPEFSHSGFKPAYVESPQDNAETDPTKVSPKIISRGAKKSRLREIHSGKMGQGSVELAYSLTESQEIELENADDENEGAEEPPAKIPVKTSVLERPSPPKLQPVKGKRRLNDVL